MLNVSGLTPISFAASPCVYPFLSRAVFKVSPAFISCNFFHSLLLL
nr:MAG TPA: hypothetical protein [Caudoviricetes sp.]